MYSHVFAWILAFTRVVILAIRLVSRPTSLLLVRLHSQTLELPAPELIIDLSRVITRMRGCAVARENKEDYP
ncbi:hypothetical protein D3C87_1399570 [compost metagenome]